MRRMRLFWLENGSGERKPLNGEEGIFLENPTGLGLESGDAYAGTGDGFFVRTKTAADKQLPIGGDLIFLKPRPYALYTAFMDWVLRSQELTLVYQPATQDYRRRVTLSAADKGEKARTGVLTVPVKLLPLTPWYTQKVETYTLGIEEDGFRVWDDDEDDEGGADDRDESDPEEEEPGGGEEPLEQDGAGEDNDRDEEPLEVDEFPLELDGGTGLEAEDETREDAEPVGESRVWDDDTTEASCSWARLTETDVLEDGVVIRAGGHVGASFDLRFTGAATRPEIAVIGAESGTEYGRCALDASTADGETLEYSTSYLDAYVRKRTADGRVIDLLDAADMQHNVFPRLPTTEPCRVLISSESSLRGVLTVAVQRYLRGV